MNSKRAIIILFIWLPIIGLICAGIKWFAMPVLKHRQEVQQAELVKKNQIAKQQEDNQLLAVTQGQSHYDHQVDFAIDSFAGFAVLRSPKFKEETAKRRIKINLIDDGADYAGRLKAFRDGKIQMGVFTIDALVKAAGQGVPPMTIVSLVDETRGADAMVAYKDVFPNVDSLNSPDVKFIIGPGPSEMLSRVLMSHFHLSNISDHPFVQMDDARAVFEQYRKSKNDAKQVYVLWEPYTSKILDNPNTHVIVDSSYFKGYILDVIVAERDFLYKNPEVVQQVLESYFRSLYEYKDSMPELMLEDGKRSGTPMSDKEAAKFLSGVWIKNTSDNFAHMGLMDKESLEPIEDIITNICNVMVSTGAMTSDPTGGKPNLLYYDGILKKMQSDGFHPGIEKTRDDKVILPLLSDSQWQALIPLGQLNIDPLVFGRGSSRLSEQCKASLDDLVVKLNSWQCYIIVYGNALNGNNSNQDLAIARANAASDYLISKGIDPNRVRAIPGKTSNETTVTFTLGQPPF